VPPTRRPRAHHRVNPYPGAHRQNETEMFSDHDETSPSIAAVSAVMMMMMITVVVTAEEGLVITNSGRKKSINEALKPLCHKLHKPQMCAQL